MIHISKMQDYSNILTYINKNDIDLDFFNEIQKNNEQVHVLLKDEVPVGVCCINNDTTAYVYIYIFPQYRTQGYGYSAFCKIEKVLLPSSPSHITTAYNGKNTIAKNFALKCGFTKKSASYTMKYTKDKFVLDTLPIREYEDEDFVEAYTLSSEAFHVMRVSTGYYPDSKPYELSEEARKYCLEHKDDHYVYVVDNEIVACASTSGAEIDTLSTKLSHQNKGYGKNFVKYLVNLILDKNIGSPFLYCIDRNINALHLYKSLGFEEVCMNEFAIKNVNN